MRRAGLTVVMVLLATVAQASPPTEAVSTRVTAVNVAGREIVAGGKTWALSSTVKVAVPGLERASLRDVKPGMNVKLDVVFGDETTPVVQALTVRAD